MKQDMNDTFRIALRAMVMAAMTLLTVSTATAQVEVHGNVYGGGNLADVKENTAVNMSAGQVYGNVYGGGKGKADTYSCEKAMVGRENEGASADLTTPENKAKGTKVTISNGTVGTLEGESGSQTLKEGTGNVYGGGEIGRVEWNTQVLIGVGEGEETFAPVIYGNVFGAGKGLETHGYSALVRGNSTVTIQGNAKVGYNVYGGGEISTVGRYWVKGINNNVSGAPEAPSDLPDGMPYQQQSGGKCSVTIQGSAIIGSLGIDDKGHVFGAGKGVEPHFVASGEGASQKMVKGDGENHDRLEVFTDNPTTGQTAEEAYLEFLQTLSLVTNSYVTIDGSAQVTGSVFGGSESGFVQHDTNVTIQGSDCEIGTEKYGNIFGGGKGLEYFAEAGKVKGNTTVTISSGTVKGNVYGGGRLGDVGTIDKTNKNDKGELTYNYFWKQSNGTTANVGEHNTNATAANTGICTVSITGGTIGLESTNEPTKHGNVFGAGRGLDDTWWCEKAIAYATSVAISNTAVVKGNVYGGGQIGRVEDDAKVVIGTADGADEPDIRGSVFGAGAGLETHGYSALVRGNAEVTVQGTAQIGGSVYGGGETASVGKFVVVGGLPTKPLTGGTCVVNIKDNAKIGSSGTGHNVYGACKGVEPTYVASGENRSKSMQLLTNAPSDNKLWSHYEDDESSPFIWRYYATEQDYLDFLKTLALTSHPHVTIGGTWTPNETTGTITASGSPTIYGSVYGGGQRGVTLGHVDVNMVGGTVEQDVYGGGALADTNLGNWDVNGYVEATGLTAGAPVTGLYTRTESEGKYTYTKITAEDATAVEGTTYYRQVPTWAHTEGSAYYTTSVDLTGGTIKGDAYGGGLGDLAERGTGHSDIEAMVYGDVSVTLGTLPTTTSSSTTLGTATAFHVATINDDESKPVVSSGRVFGCNNLNGSPKGSVLVTVNKTVAGNISRTHEDQDNTGRPPMGDASPADRSYEVAAVYGGGNLSDYEPYSEEGETEKKMPRVRLTTCDISVEDVYGGGNAAKVPATDVLIQGAYEIENVFGGGNGADKYTLDGGITWKTNNGADVGTESNPGDANTLMLGGYIHSAFGGSNSKGDIFGTVYIDKSSGGCDGCPVQVDKMVAAGNNADFNQDVKVVVGCQGSDKTPMRFFGADNANVNGNVEVTITSGNYGQVFAGNNIGGAIRGHIIMNIEETSDCEPIRIDELYLGGNEAAYSRFGYYVKTTTSEGEGAGIGAPSETPALDNDGRLVFMPRKSADDPHKPVNTYDRTNNKWTIIENEADYPLYDQPVLNIISCTRIDKVYGGGYGAGATLYGDPIVNINMIPGKHASSLPSQMNTLGLPSTDNSDKLGIIGDVFGGGNAAKIEGNTTVNIGTATTVNLTSIPDDDNTNNVDESLATVKGAYIVGNVYGGGNEADVTGNTLVNICAKKETDGTYTSVAFAGSSGVKITSKTVDGEKVGGNVYGGGKGVADNFLCNKAMIGTNDAGLDENYTDGNTSVVIGNGTVNGTVYGGGQIGRVERNTTVTIGLGEGTATGTATSAPEINGNVFGAGAGEEEHGYAALVRGNPTVIIKGNAKIGKSVYGGGEIASVARYKVAETVEEATAHGVGVDMPYVLENNAYGHCVVTIGGYAEIGPDNMKMYHEDMTDGTDKPDDFGHVFGAGKGVLPKVYAAYGETNNGPRRMILAADKTTSIWEYFADETKYFEFIKTLALATETKVTIGDHAFVKGSVYGGSENGLVQFDTDVTIQDHCQIGQGKEITTRYEDYTGGNLFESTVPPIKSGSGSEAVYYDLECASWEYDSSSGAPYDPNAKYLYDGKYYYDKNHENDAAGGSIVGKDGHTYYGNVFGGGSGSVPYFDTNQGRSRYVMSAGWVKGNTNVTINGGHILTNVYGGNEATNVDGTATVTMNGGTVGVPRTLAQIDAHPVTCYLFGAGKGDQRVFFNKDTNVKDVVVNITGGRIFGSVFGGGEDGHVLRDVTMTIGTQTTTGEGAQATTTTSGPTIGTWGTSYVDGNVFGGGRGFGGDAYTAGNVAGSVTMNINGGTMLGSIYGGGRLGSVGYGFFDETTNGQPTPGYGEMRADEDIETGFSAEGFFTNGRGHIDITISGGTIGNDYEYIVPNSSNIPNTITQTDISKWTSENWATWKAHNHIPKTEFDASGRLTHTKGGNVFAGGMGRQTQLDGQTPISAINWWQLGCVKQTKLTITGGHIKSNVYGGGELGAVIFASGSTTEGGTTEIDISGSAVIGTPVTESVTTGEGQSAQTNDVDRYTFGSVFGGGMGSENYTSTEEKIGGRVAGSTKITMTGGDVKASVYGGGELAIVQGSHTAKNSKNEDMSVGTEINISGGTIGYNQDGFGGATMGNVYGGGKGSLNTANAGLIKNNTLVKITGTPTIYHNVYGGGAYGSVGTFTFTTGAPTWPTDNPIGKAEVIVEGGTIGINGHENGMVFGSSRGDVAAPVAPSQGATPVDPNDRLAWVYDTHVVIGNSSGGPTIKGTVYGSGENGHTFNNTLVDVNKGTIGIETGEDITYTENGKPFTKGGAAYPYRGNVYGGGCGTDTYSVTVTEGEGQSAVTKTIKAFNPLAGIVLGNATVNINGGKVVRNVYGAGAMGSVGKTTWTTTTTTTGDVTTTTKSATTSGGLTTVNVKGGTIGVSGTVGDGNVFGAARGSKDVVQADQNDISRVRETNVKISGGSIKGNVYGGGELGDVGTIVKNTSDYNYTWQKNDGGSNVPENNKITENNTNTGICNVTITGGTIGSTTEGTGNVFGGGKGDANTWWCEKAIAFATNVSISKGSDAENAPVVYGTVYGGGEIGRVEDDTKVIIGTADGGDEPDIKGNVFGAGKGMATRGYSALVRGNSIVTIQGKAKVGGNVFGGGEEASLGRFNLDKGLPKSPASGGSSEVTIQGNANIGSSGTGNHVYGAGQGVTPAFDTSNNFKNNRSMQLFDNRPKGEKDLVGTYWDYYVDDDGNEDRRFVWVYYKTEPEYQAFLNTLALASHPTVNIAENAIVYGDVYGGGQRGITLGDVAVNITGGTVMNDVYGGGSLADTNKGNWDDSQYVEVTGLPVGHTLTDLYTRTGGSGTTDSPYTYAATESGAEVAANATYYSKGTWATDKYDATTHATSYKTNVTLTGGTIKGNVYGGGLGQIGREASAAVGTEGDTNYTPAVTKLDEVKAKVYGDVLVTLNGTKTAVTTGTGENATTTDVYNDDCVVEGNIFGCNNQNGSPQSAVTVHVYKTQGWDGHTGTAQDKLDSETAADHSYHVKGVYGGGNLSAFYPDLKATRDTVQTYVIIDGCKMTSIKQVYGGGNAASAPATNITINATYEIEEVFGGGNGLDDITIHGATMTNPGANVGYEGYPTSYDIPASSKEERTAKFSYGSGKASVTIYDGKIHRVFGGSNNKGNVRESAVTLLDDMSGCDFQVDEAYGGGKNAPMDAEAKLLMACIPGLKVAYGGAQEADVLGGVNMTITNGTYERVFGGNNISGTIQGPIVVNVEETGCRPIIIGELYGGGNKAGYSVYGYGGDDGRTPIEPGENVTRKWDDPQVNVKSFTSIGNVYGGGYGKTATMVANPTVNINVAEGKYSSQTSDGYFIGFTPDATNKRYSKVIDGNTVYVPAHKENTIGAIYNVFGGGNAAKVIGNPNVNIGTRMGADEYMAVVDVPTTTVTTADGYYTRSGEGTATSSYVYTLFTGTPSAGTTYYKKYTIKGADIRGNVYGGGNNADVTGNTNVVIGKKAE